MIVYCRYVIFQELKLVGGERFDLAVSIEMFDCLRNSIQELLRSFTIYNKAIRLMHVLRYSNLKTFIIAVVCLLFGAYNSMNFM